MIARDSEQNKDYSNNGHAFPILTIRLAGQAYGLPVSKAVQIIEMVTITHIPQTPAFMRGIINYRGDFVPIIDLRLRFGLPSKPYGVHTPIVLVDFNNFTLGIVVDTVEEVLEIDRAHLESNHSIFASEPFDDNGHSVEKGHIAGLAKVDRRIISILNINSLLTDGELDHFAKAVSASSLPAVRS